MKFRIELVILEAWSWLTLAGRTTQWNLKLLEIALLLNVNFPVFEKKGNPQCRVNLDC